MEQSTRPPHDDERCASGEECFACHLRGVRIGLPSDFRSRSNYLTAPPREPGMSYEKAIPTSKRPGGFEMPYLRSDGDAMRQKEFNAKARLIDDNRRRIEATASAA